MPLRAERPDSNNRKEGNVNEEDQGFHPHRAADRGGDYRHPAAIAVPNFLEAQVRSKVSRVRSDHRSLATAIEAYFVDNNTYPASTVTKANNAYATFPGTALDNCRTFRLRLTSSNINCMTLTTPVAYVTSLFAIRSRIPGALRPVLLHQVGLDHGLLGS
jgi:hypothetical protein